MKLNEIFLKDVTRPIKGVVKADDADHLVCHLDTGVLGALPLTVGQGRAGGNDIAGRGQQKRDGKLSGTDDVRGGRIDDHHAGLGSGLDVDIVEANPGASDHLEVLRCCNRLRIDHGGRTHEDRVDVSDGRQQGRPVRSVARDDLEVGAEGLDRGRGQLFGDENAGLGHARSLPRGKTDSRAPTGSVVPVTTRESGG